MTFSQCRRGMIRGSRLTMPLFRQSAQEPLHLLRGFCGNFTSGNSTHLVVFDVDQCLDHELRTRTNEQPLVSLCARLNPGRLTSSSLPVPPSFAARAGRCP